MALLLGFLFGLLAAPFGVLSQIQLVPSAPAVVKPGESLTVTCKVSGDSIATRAWWNWVRELPGRGLQWVGRIHFSGSTNYAPDLQTRANIAKDDAKNEYYLELRSLTAADTATYYCTRWDFAYWGQGTLVTVTTANPTTPSVFPLVPCCSKTGNAPMDSSLACLVTGYLPSPVDIKWNSGKVTKGVKTFPEMMMSNGLHTQSSLLSPSDSSQQGVPYQCDVMHQGTAKTVSKKFPQELCGLMMPPQVHLLIPTCEDSATESQLELVCLLLNFRPGKADVKWLVNGKERSPPTPAFSSAMGTDGSYMGQSRMNVTRQSWEKGDIYTCQVTHPAVGPELSMHNTSKCLACLRSSLDPTIYLTKPSYEDVIKNSGHVTCLVLGYDLAASRIAWKVDGQVSSAAKTEPPQKNNNGTTSLVSSHPVSLAQWGQGTKFTCKVTTPCSGELIQDITMSNTGISKKEPSVTISRAYHEDISGNRVSLTLICEASGFYPEEISISWLKNNSPELKSSYNNGPVSGSVTFSAYSVLKVDKSREAVNYTCVVHHPAMEEPKRVVEKVSLVPTNLQTPTVELLQSIDLEKKTVMLKCIAYDYRPKGVTIKWQGKLHPASEQRMEDGTYRASHHFETTMDKWKEEANYTCEVEHKETGEKVTKKTVSKDWMLPSAPTVTLHILPACPSPGASDTVTLFCSASGYYPRDLQLTWQAGGKEREGTQVGLLQGKDGRFSSSSNLTMFQAEWDELGEYSCHVTHPGTGSTQLSTTSKCAACQGSVPLPNLYLLKPSLEPLLTRGEALLTCLAVGYELGQARLTWELDGANWTANATVGEAKNHSNQTQSLLSHLAIPRGVWDSGRSILCRVTHPCSLFQGMEETIQKFRGASITKAPSVSLVIPSPAQHCRNAEVWLTCEVSDFFPSELLIEWKRDNHSIEPSGYITLPPVAKERNSTFSTQSYLKIPVSQWESGAVYTCMVGHESLPSMHYTSRTVLDFLEPSPPTVTVFHAPDIGGHENLTCFATGFYPKHLDMQWTVNKQHLNCSSPSSPTALGDGRFQQSCQLGLRAAEWSTLKTYTCTVIHSSTKTTLEKALHSTGCWEPELPSAYIQPPSLKELFMNEMAAVTCKTSLVNASINWMMDGELADLGAVRMEQLNGSTWLQSWLQVNLSEWNSTETVRCQIKSDLVENVLGISPKNGSLKAPTVYLLPPSSEEICSNQNLTLHCIVKDFYPGEISIWWQEKTAETEVDIPADNENHDCDHNSHQCSVISKLEVSRSKWILGTSYSCLVAHLSSEGIIARSANVHTESWHCTVLGINPCSVRDDSMDDYSELDDAQCVWTTVSTFIALFLVTLFYSGFVTFIKVK
ncbi:uncharacterized protein LOC119842114 isoform X2 [Dermochelys coriacea]|uniref:uncharacterized protein LOC119842114 isoform X2 n=2 Tax=Dermochelys coriacea TaxID=27794 RepID=UPI001CA9340B|nr:uncharacterized protein LOC119842114 isoform X2 [Dermochelys coriacea]